MKFIRFCQAKKMIGVHPLGQNFTWPTSGEAVCPDWDPKPECGNGLHGFYPDRLPKNVVKCLTDLWTKERLTNDVRWRKDQERRYSHVDWAGGFVWLVLEVAEEDVVPLDEDKSWQKVKFPRCTVLGTYPTMEDAVEAAKDRV
jgi:hypothetical protein